MNREFQIEPNKTYATQENARKAMDKGGFQELRHFFMVASEGKNQGRWFPVFAGIDAMNEGVHFHFSVMA